MRNKTLLLVIGLLTVTVIGYSAPSLPIIKATFENSIHRTFTVEDIVSARISVVEELNVARVELGIEKVALEYSLEASAQTWAYQLSDGNVTHDIERKTGEFTAEVILMYEGDLKPEVILTEFMRSQQHKDIIMNAGYRKIGVGIKRWQGANFVVMRFI